MKFANSIILLLSTSSLVIAGDLDNRGIVSVFDGVTSAVGGTFDTVTSAIVSEFSIVTSVVPAEFTTITSAVQLIL